MPGKTQAARKAGTAKSVKSAKTAAVVGPDSTLEEEATFWRDVATRRTEEAQAEWYKLQLAGWVARVMSELWIVQIELERPGSSLAGAIGPDEAAKVRGAIDEAWRALANRPVDFRPAFLGCAPGFGSKLPRNRK